MAATQSTAFSDYTYYIRVRTDAACYYATGLNPTATTTIGENNATRYLPADTFLDLPVQPGHKISAITGSGTATLEITEMGRDHHSNDNLPKEITVQAVSVTT